MQVNEQNCKFAYGCTLAEQIVSIWNTLFELRITIPVRKNKQSLKQELVVHTVSHHRNLQDVRPCNEVWIGLCHGHLCDDIHGNIYVNGRDESTYDQNMLFVCNHQTNTNTLILS